MAKYLDDDIVRKAISELDTNGNYNVTSLAKYLDVSRSRLYKDFYHLLPETDDGDLESIIHSAIKSLRIKHNTKKISISELSKELNVSRPTIYRHIKKFADLDKYINGEKDFAEEDLTNTPEQIIRKLEAEIERIKSEHDVALEQLRSSIFSSYMIRDIKTFSSQETDVTLNKLQVKNDELAGNNRRYLNEIAALKAEIIDLKHSVKGGINTVVKGHFKADYKPLKANLDSKEFFKLFIECELDNLEKAIEFCIANDSSTALFLQSQFTYKFEQIPIRIDAKDLVIIESNLFQNKYYCKLIEELPNTAIHAVYTNEVKLPTARYFCRQNFGTGIFTDEFLTNLSKRFIPPAIVDGFSTISIVSASTGLVVVK